MSVEYIRKEYGKGIYINEITDKKFKSNAVIIRMIVPMDVKKAALYSLVTDILASSNNKYHEIDKLSQALMELYSASISSNGIKLVDNFSLVLSINYIGDDFTIGKEVISDKTIEILLDCLLDPHLENGLLSEKYLKICCQNILDEIKAIVNNKRRYAFEKAKYHIFEGENTAISLFDYEKYIKDVTVKEVTEAYYELLKTATFDITITGCGCSEKSKKTIIDRISAIDREPALLNSYNSPSPIKSEICNESEKAEINQCKLIMAFKTENQNEYACKLLNIIYGANPTSKLFTNVREKLSLCYYCSTGMVDMKNTLLVNSGLDKEKIETAKNEIIKQLDEIKQGKFTDKEFEEAKLYLADAYLSNYDSKFDMDTWYLYQRIHSTSDTPEEKAAKIKALTREELINEAKGYKLDTVFVLEPDNKEGGI